MGERLADGSLLADSYDEMKANMDVLRAEAERVNPPETHVDYHARLVHTFATFADPSGFPELDLLLGAYFFLRGVAEAISPGAAAELADVFQNAGYTESAQLLLGGGCQHRF